MEMREVIPLKQKPNWTVALPGSKSITNRVFLCAALAKGKSRIYGALESDDSKVMFHALQKVGIKVSRKKDHIEIIGTGGKFNDKKVTLDLHNAGTATRFLTAAMILRKAETIITGNKRMQERPIADLVGGLTQLGVDITYLKRKGCPPLKIGNSKFTSPTGSFWRETLNSNYTVQMKGDKSSQYFTALLILAPMLGKPVRIEVVGDLVSKPYIDITLSVLKQFGVKVTNNQYQSFFIKPQKYKAGGYRVEGDASAASYWTSIAWLHKGNVKFNNLTKKSAQGDVRYADILPKLGKGEINMEAMPDAAMTLAVTAPFVKGTTKITGLSTLRIKETDRLAALENELKKIGVQVKAEKDWIDISGMRREGAIGQSRLLRRIATYNDHRMAMCFAVFGTMVPGVMIEDPACTEKTYPHFWEDLELAYLAPIKPGNKNLVLTGMRGSGKGYYGKKIARLLKRKFVDLDAEIERHEKMKITEIVKREGWPYFREIEQKICSAFAKASADKSFEPVVIATGGGVILDPKNMKALKKNGINVFIFADVSTLAKRIEKSKNRPPLKGKHHTEELREVWEERRHLYLKYADHVWDDTSGKVIEKNLGQLFR